MNMDDMKGLKPDWTNRRKVIKSILTLLSVLLTLSLIGATALAYFAKFGLYISMFYIVFMSLNFAVILGIVGSYVFGARWENKDFLRALSDIVPDFKKNDPPKETPYEPTDIPPEP